MRNLRKSRKGMTGIETAIIVIAFVIAASVFAFAILNMGLLTTGKAQQSVTNGINEAQSSMEVTSAYAYCSNSTAGNVTGIAIVVQPSGTGSTDFTQGKISISLAAPNASYANVYTTSNFITATTFDNATYLGSFTTYSTNAPNCSVIELSGNGNQLLEQGEQFAVFLNLTALNVQLQAYNTFTVQLTPSSGAKLTCTYNIPADVTPVMVLSGS